MKHPERRKPVLIIQHAPHEHPASIRRALEAQGVSSLWIHPYLGDAYPDLEEVRGIISLGGPMGANDEAEHPWIASELDLLKRAVHDELPVLGVCLGGQMMARALGGRVRRTEEPEIGWLPVEINPSGMKDPVFREAGPSARFYQWHFDTFELPPGATLLAASEACERQAYRLGDRAYGLQFHPEADSQLMEEWLDGHGPAEDIQKARSEHGDLHIQDVETQRRLAVEGELFNVTVVASASRLFNSRAFAGPLPEVSELLEEITDAAAPVQIRIEGSHRKPFSIEGTIDRRLMLANGAFVILREKNRILWPIREDRILSVQAIDSRDPRPYRR